jgi:phi13 family phage major tail protein
MGKIIHGNKNFGYAPITETGGVYSFGTPVMVTGLVSATIEVEQESSSVYADDKEYCRVKGAKVRTATVTFRNIPASYAPFLGFVENESGMLTDTGVFANHCIFFETEEEDCDTGLSTTTLHYLYNVQASEPTMESTTDEDEVEAAEIEVEYNASDSPFVVDDNGKAVQYGYITRTEANKTAYDAFTSAVIKPVA